MNDSILRSGFRAFCVVLFSILGIFASIVVIVMLLSLFGDGTKEIDTKFSQKIMPNAEGVRKEFLTSVPVILQIDIDGVIGMDSLTTETINDLLVASREGSLKDDRVKAILLRMKTPGGTVTDANGIYNALKSYKERYHVPIYAYVDGICASGGIYVACAADKVYANEISLIGSIGVVMPSFFNFTDLLEKYGVHTLTISAGKDKDIMNPVRKWKPGEEKDLQELVNFYYQNFVDVVVDNRSVDKQQLIDQIGATVFDAPRAVGYGLINASGFSMQQTLKEILKAANIDGDYQVIALQKRNWYTDIFESQSTLLQGKIVHQLKLPLEMDPKFNNQPLYLYR